MSVTFYGRTASGAPISLDIEDPAHVSMNGANARAFLLFLGIEPGDDLSGDASLPEVRRGIMRARATFERRVSGYTRAGSDTKRPGQCRVIEGGIDDTYFETRLGDFERFLDAVIERGAVSVCWG